MVHLCHRPDTAARQLRYLATHVDADAEPALLLGDFNLWGGIVRRLLPRWTVAASGATWPARRPRHSIDQVLQRGLRVAGATLVDPGGSDHLAIRATLGRSAVSGPRRPSSRPSRAGG